jgi:hypothetical protein
MNCFLVEIYVPQMDEAVFELAARTLLAVQSRLSRNASVLRLLIAGFTQDDGHLVCLIDAPAAEAVRNMVALAFLPAGRIRELSVLDLACGQNPRGDLGSGTESQLVEDVVEVCLHGPLGKE